MPINRKHAIVSGCVLAAVAGTFTSIIGRGAKANQGDSEARPAAVALVFRKPLSDTVKLSGEFRPFQEVDVHAKVAGYIRVIRVEVGDRVKQGQVLAVLEVAELRAELQGSDALVRRSQDSVRRAQSDLQRAESVHDAAHLNFSRLKEASATRPGIIAQQELDDSEARDKEAEAQISADQAALSEAENQLDVSLASQKQYTALSDYTNIVAPFDGVVTRCLSMFVNHFSNPLSFDIHLESTAISHTHCRSGEGRGQVRTALSQCDEISALVISHAILPAAKHDANPLEG